MKRKILACITACALAICCFVPVSFAAGNQTTIENQAQLEEAIANNDTIDLTGKTIELDHKLVIKKSVKIIGGNLVGSGIDGTGVLKNVVEVDNGGNLTLEGTTIKSFSNHALNVYGGGILNATDVTLDHEDADGGAPVVVTKGSSADFNGTLTLKLGSNSWYGINSDASTVDISGANLTITGATGTKSVICADNNGTVVDTNNTLTKVVTTKEGKTGDATQVAYVNDANLANFVAAKADKNVSEIELTHNVQLNERLYLHNATTVNGNGYALIGTDAIGKDNVVTVLADGTELNNLTVKTSAANKSALHLFNADATLTNVTLDNQETVGGAGMIVNGCKATINGKLNIILGPNSWGGINIDEDDADSNVEFASGSQVTLTGSTDKNVIYVDNDNGIGETVTGAENAGLTQDADGNFVIAKEDPTQPIDPTQPGDKPAQDGDKTPATDADKEKADYPKTGDESASYGLLIALMLCSGAGIYALRRNAK